MGMVLLVTGPVAVAAAPHTAEQFARQAKPVRVLHFVTGGFSGGATQVAIALTRASLAAGGPVQPLLVLRSKLGIDPARIAGLREQGIPVATVPRWPHLATILRLALICRSFRADVLIAHGYSEHLWGRYAGLLAGVKNLVQVEHNTRERYTPFRRLQARWLARRTACFVGCSQAVCDALFKMGLPAERIMAIPNGIGLERFSSAEMRPFSLRIPGIVMVARFSRQKDHATLLRAIALLRGRGLRPPVVLAGGGKRVHRDAAQALANELGLSGQVNFMGVCSDVPALLMDHQIAVLSTHHEGMPLALLEGMAAGCAVVGSDVQGVREVIHHGIDGMLVAAGDPARLALVLEGLLRNRAKASALAARARESAIRQSGLDLMNRRYESLCLRLARHHRVGSA